MQLLKLLDYTIWAEERYLSYCKDLTEDEFTQDVLGLDKSLQTVVFHIYEASWYWYHFLTDQDYSDEPDPAMKREALITNIREIQTTIYEYARSQDLSRTYELQWNGEDKVVLTTAHNIIFNLVTHSAYHRGQLALLLRKLGYSEIDETDFNPWIYTIGQN